MRVWIERKSWRWCVCAVALACGPSRTDDTATGSTTSTGTTASATSTSTGDAPTTTIDVTTADLDLGGSPACALGDGAVEGEEHDPDGCYTITDADACEALEQDATCLAIWGRAVECDEGALCSDAKQVFLGCRPWAICKTRDLLVCKDDDAGAHAFWAQECLPAGFYPCEPEPDLAPPSPCPDGG